ncbi:MAG: T9SS type A sorting domain-containing protein [Bacteroidota bacterium]
MNRFMYLAAFYFLLSSTAHSQYCYTVMEDLPEAKSADCDNIDFVYNTINSVQILPRFHFVKFKEYQFECGHSNPNFDAVNVVTELIGKMNTILGNFAVNSNGGSQLPNNGESKIRFFDTPDVFDCSNIYFWDNLSDYTAANVDDNSYDIIFTEKAKVKYDSTTMMLDTTYSTSGEKFVNSIRLYNVHHDAFVELRDLNAIANDYDGLAVHELFHEFGLHHSWECVNRCADMDDVIECGGMPASGAPCGSICATFAADGVWNNSNNTMGYNPQQDALSKCQYAEAFEKIIEEKPWKYVEYNDNYVCEDIIIDESYDTTTIWQCNKILECNLEIHSGRELIMDQILVEMGAGTSIILHPGSRLILRGTLINSIEKVQGSWEGIRIRSGDGTPQYDDPFHPIETYSPTKAATLVMERAQVTTGTAFPSRIQQAKIGILTGDARLPNSGGGLIDIDFGYIEQCDVGIQFESYVHYNKSRFVRATRFSNTQDMVIKSNHGFYFDTPQFINTLNAPSSGLILYNSSIDQLLSPIFSFKTVGMAVLGSHPGQSGFTIGDRVDIGTTIPTRFSSCDIGIGFSSQGFGAVENMLIKDVKFRVTDVGIFAVGESEYQAYGNEFENLDGNSFFMLGFSTGHATNDSYCNTITSESGAADPINAAFVFQGDNRNTTIYSNTFGYASQADECIRTVAEGDIFPIQATSFNPIFQQINQNLPASNDFKDSNQDLLIDDLGSEITYLTPQDNSLIEYFPEHESNYKELQSIFNPLGCEEIIGKPHEPDTIVVGDDMPPIVKDEWDEPIGDPIAQEEYINFIFGLDPGVIDNEDRDREVTRARYAQYNAVVAASASPNYISTLRQLDGNVWRRLEYGYHIENKDYSAAEQLIQTMPDLTPEDNDFIFIQTIVLDKIDHINNRVLTPYTISNSEKNRIETIIDVGNKMSGYAMALYFDLYGEVRFPTRAGIANPRRSNNSISSELQLYPNPTRQEIFIEGLEDGVVIEIIDIDHTLLKRVNYKKDVSVDISDLKPGIYFVKTPLQRTLKFIKI